jgi:glycosyltransferase involved in cell wall biosynthesis
MILSIVIPMYNIEKFIGSCLDSCLNQKNVSCDEYEIIVVNDGSTDSGEECVQKYIASSTNVKLVTQKNGGLSAARNTGLINARGKYIWFVDGDDEISADALDILFQSIRCQACHAYIFNYTTFDDANEVIATSDFTLPKDVFSSKDLMFREKRFLPMMAWLTVYERDFLLRNNLAFLVGVLHEDLDFSLRSFSLCESVFYIKSPLYRYRCNRNDSIMNKAFRDNTKSLISYDKIIESLKMFFLKNGLDKKNTNWILANLSYMIFLKIYSDGFVLNDATRFILGKREEYYGYMWSSKLIKYRFLTLFLKCVPNWMALKTFRWYTKRI